MTLALAAVLEAICEGYLFGLWCGGISELARSDKNFVSRREESSSLAFRLSGVNWHRMNISFISVDSVLCGYKVW
jgi:hypothetical protein